MTEAEERARNRAEFRSDIAYYRALTHQAKMARRGLAPPPLVPPYFPGIGAVMMRLAPPPSVPAREVGTLREKPEGRIKFRVARRARGAA